jgi:hypothetical protein
MTTAQPAASADAAFPQTNRGLPFHGVSRPATPTGTLVMVALPLVSPKVLRLEKILD